MLEIITDWLIKRRLKREHLEVEKGKDKKEVEFMRVLNTLRENKVMVDTRDDGIYIRMAGDESKGECCTHEFGKVVSFEKNK